MVRRHLEQSLQHTPRIRIETFGLFLLMAGVLTSLEFTVFHIQTGWAEAGREFWRPEISLDAHIPLVPAWIWPYWLYFAFLGTPIWLVRDRLELAELAGGVVFVHLVGFAFFLVWPSEMPRAPLTCSYEELTCGLVGAMYLLDPGYGVFPSLHVAASVFIAAFAFRVHSRLAWPIFGFAVAVVASTLFVRQHYIIDLPAGMLLAAVAGRVGMTLGRTVAGRVGFDLEPSLDNEISRG